MDGKRRHHFEWDETKISILEFILAKSAQVKERDIAEFMKGKYEGFDRTVTNKHLHTLENLGCIEAVSPMQASRYNYWDITKLKHLKSIQENYPSVVLNRAEKSINIVLKEFYYNKLSNDYTYRFIQLYMSPSFFSECLMTGIDTLLSRAWTIFQHNSSFKDGNQIQELLTELNAEYMEDKLNFKMSEDCFRKVMEKLSQKRKKIYEDCIWLTYGVHSEDKKKHFKDLCNIDDFDQSLECDIQNSLNIPGWYIGYPKPWIESFNKNLKEYVPELSMTVTKTIQMTDDEEKNMYSKLEKLLSLMEKQRNDFYYARFDVLFEYFFFKDVMSDAVSGEELKEEIAFAQSAKKIISDLLEGLKRNKEYTHDIRLEKLDLVYKKHEIEIKKMIQNFKDKHHMPTD